MKEHTGKALGLITPGDSNASRQLLKHADFTRRIRPGALKISQLPDTIPGTTIRKPGRW